MAVSSSDPALDPPESAHSLPLGSPSSTNSARPLALIVFLENVGHISGVNLPGWTRYVIDWVTEEYAKVLLRLLGAHRRYDQVIILEDQEANGVSLSRSLLEMSQTHTLDLLLLVHGQPASLVGYRGEVSVGEETFGPLLKRVQADPDALSLRMVYGLNCHGITLAPTWIQLGARVCNGAVGVNWLPEPSLTLFLYAWLRGEPYSRAVERSFRWARRVGRRLWPDGANGPDPHILGSHQVIFGTEDITISS